MKKVLSIILAAVLLVSLCCGCNAEQSAMRKLTRQLKNTTWTAISATDAIGGMIFAKEIESRMGGLKYEFKRGGKVISTTLGQSTEGTWEATSGNTVQITLGEASIIATKTETSLQLDYLGSTFLLTEE